ncbi:hypothetical protein H0X48_04720 [Candidatus Dependentiae bacterium]|nr:hypothetical protein [Candidatus Dependentiae bacterium]
MYCVYYQAHVEKKEAWFFVAVLRSYEHLVFDRTYDKAESIFEFFVPEHNEIEFVKLMHYFIKQNTITYFEHLPHRLLTPGETV